MYLQGIERLDDALRQSIHRARETVDNIQRARRGDNAAGRVGYGQTGVRGSRVRRPGDSSQSPPGRVTR